MPRRSKAAIAVLHEDIIFLECPFCGKTLIRANFQKIEKLLAEQGAPRGKICPKCNEVAVFKFSSEVKETVRQELARRRAESAEAPTVRLEDLT
jgi:phage FluMu protein Com